MLEIRTKAKDLVDRLDRGESFRITYRNRPVGEIYPLTQREEISSEDPIYSVADSAEILGGELDARTADRLVYGD